MRRVAGMAVMTALLGLGVPAQVDAQESDQVAFKTGALEVSMGGRVHLQLGTSSCSAFPTPDNSACAEQVPATDLFLRRARLTFTVKINDMIDFRIQPDFNKVDQVGLKDAWGRFTFSKSFRLKGGHFKRPFDEFFIISSTQTLTVERALAIRGIDGLLVPNLTSATVAYDLSDRDIGLEASGSTNNGVFSYWAGVFTGDSDLKFQDSNTEKQFIGRGQVKLGAGPKDLKFAAAAAATDQGYETPTEGLQGRYYYNFELYAEWGDFSFGPHAQLGFVFGDNPFQNVAGADIDLASGEDFAKISTWQGIVSWKFPIGSGNMALEPLLRFGWADTNTDVSDNEVWGFTPGLQIFFYGRNKLALNWDIASPTTDAVRSENSFKARLSFHF